MSEVFVSYRRENDAHCARVRALAEKLEAAGFRVIFDEFAKAHEFHGAAPPRGWDFWSIQMATDATSVLVIGSAGWFRVINDAEPTQAGLGAASEAETIMHRLNRASGFNTFVNIGYFAEEDLAELPVYLDKCGRFDLTSDDHHSLLVQWLRRPIANGNDGTTARHRSATTLIRADGVRIHRQLPPASVSKFEGRVTQLKQLTQRLRDGLSTAVVGAGGYGKTALAAEAVLAVVGPSAESLAASPFPEGVLFLDLYAFRGQAEPVWQTLANLLAGEDFRETSPAQIRAQEACRQRRVLVIIEGGEEADGQEGRARIEDLRSVLAPENRCLLLTRDIRQAQAGAMIRLEEPLSDREAGRLFDGLTGKRVQGAVRERILKLLAGHPLGLTWAGGLLARDDEDPSQLAQDWESDPTRLLSDPMQAEHTLGWLFTRSVRGLDETARQALAAAGLLARAPFPIESIEAAVFHTRPRFGGEVRGEGAVSVREAIKQLIDRGLLRRSGEDEHREFTHVLGYRFARNESASDAGLRNGLAGWLNQRLSAALTVGANPTDGLADLLQHAAALLRTDHDQQLWLPLTNFLLYDARDRLVSLGRLDWVNTALGIVSEWLDRFATYKADEPVWQRERSACFSKLGELATAQGNLPGAQRHYGETHRISQRLAEADPTNAEWQDDLSVSFEKLGDLARDQGSLSEAQRLFGECHRIRQRLAESDPASTEWQRGLSVSFVKLGDLIRAQGNVTEAQWLFGESLRIRQRLVESDPANAEWQRDLSVSFDRLGNLVTDQGTLTEAQRLFGESLRIRQHLTESDPANVAWQFALGVSNERQGKVAAAQGNLEIAHKHYSAKRSIIQRLAESDPANAAWQRDLSVSFNKLGVLATAQRNLPEAQWLFGESHRIRQRLAESDPSNANWQRDLSVSLNNLGDLATAQGNLPEAQRLFGESLRIRQRLAESDPANAEWQRDLSVSYWRVADVLEQLDSPEAMAYWCKAHDTLAGFAAAGWFVSPQDQQVLEQLRAKLNP